MKWVVLFSVVIVCISACTINHRLYSSTQVNNPSLESKNDYSVNLSYSNPSGFDFNGGYAITDRWAIIGGLYSYKNKDQEENFFLFSSDHDSSSLSYKHKGFHIGTGIFIPLSKTPSIFLSFFSGYTNGSFEMREVLYNNNATIPKLNFYKSDINRWFLQGALNLYFPSVHQSFITRLNYVGYGNVVTDYTANEQSAYNLPPVVYPKWSTFLDFSFDTKIFFSKEQRLGLQIFGIATGRLNRKEHNFNYYPFRLGAGIVLKSPFKKTESKK